MFLIDTNIFIEGLLEQDRASQTKNFLEKTDTAKMFVSDFSLHSIGIILYRFSKFNYFPIFVEEVISDRIEILMLSTQDLIKLKTYIDQFNLDFDDAYQYAVAKKHNLKMITFDSDLKKTDLEIVSP